MGRLVKALTKSVKWSLRTGLSVIQKWIITKHGPRRSLKVKLQKSSVKARLGSNVRQNLGIPKNWYLNKGVQGEHPRNMFPAIDSLLCGLKSVEVTCFPL